MSSRTGRRLLSTPVSGLLALLAAAALAACTGTGTPEPDPSPSPSVAGATGPVALTFGVFGSAAEVSGYDDMVADFNSISETSTVSIESWRNHDEAMAELGPGQPLPDVFMTSRLDLATLLETDQVQPVDELLDARGLDFGDGYSRDALRAFSADNRLQCMPYGISPMVIYYNTELIDFARMRARGLSAPGADNATEAPRSWSFEDFAAAAEYATRPRRNTRGVSIDATLTGLSPFVISGDGSIFDDDEDPSSLALSEESSREALETTLGVLRNAQVTLSPEQLAERPARDWFKRGKLGMMAGFRELVPGLRKVQGLEFDVMPMPVLEGPGTVGEFTGLCLSTLTEHSEEAADFLAHALSVESVTKITRAGFLVPSNVEVAASDDFLQAGRLPVNSRVYTVGRDIYIPPLITSWDVLEATAAPSLDQLVTSPGAMDPDLIEEITTGIDEQSRPILAPDDVSPSPE